jgi:hypothetical protein
MEHLASLGPWAQLVLGSALAGLLFLLVAFAGALRGRRVPGPLWVLPAAVTAGLGLFGALRQLDELLVRWAPDGRARDLGGLLVRAGDGLLPAAMGCELGGGLAVIAALALALRPALQRERETRWSASHALLPALIAAVGAPVLARFSAPIAPLIALVCALPCVVVGLRSGGRGERVPVARQLAEERVTVALLAFLGALALAQATRIHAAMGLFFGVADPRAMLAETLHGVASGPATILAALLVAGAGAAVVAPAARCLGSWRVPLGVGAMLLLVAPALLARQALTDTLGLVRLAAQPWYIDRVETLAAGGLDLPLGASHQVPREQLTLLAAPGRLELDGRALVWEGELLDGMHRPLFEALDSYGVLYSSLMVGDPTFRGELSLEAHRELRWGELEPLMRAMVGARFQQVWIRVSDDQRRLRSLELSVVGAPHPLAGQAEMASRKPREAFIRVARDLGGQPDPRVEIEALGGVWRILAPGLDPEPAADTEQLAAAAARVKERYPEDEELLVRPLESTTLAELVSVFRAVRGEGDDLAFPSPWIRLDRPESEPASTATPP